MKVTHDAPIARFQGAELDAAMQSASFFLLGGSLRLVWLTFIYRYSKIKK